MPIQGVGTTPFFNVAANGVVNSTGAGNQNDVHVALLSDGRLVFAWTTDSDNIRARVFNADGTPSGDDFTVATITDGLQFQISLAALQDNNFVITWQSTEAPGDGSGNTIRARVFDADTPLTAAADFIVNTTTDDHQRAPAVAMLSDGRFVVAWSSEEDTGPGGDFSVERARIFNADGTSSENDFIVNSELPGIQRIQEGSAITAFGTCFLVTWLSGGEEFASAKMRARLFDANGDPIGESFILNSSSHNFQGITPAVAVLDNGNFVVTWQSNDNDPVNDPFAVDSQDGSGLCVRARIFTPDGTPLGLDFIVNSTAEGDQVEPSVVALADGRFVIAYTSWEDGDGGGGGSPTCVRARIFDNDGTPSGDDFILNFVAQSQQFRPTLVALADGRFVATWESSENVGGDGNGGTVRAQVFDPKVFNGTDGDDTWRGGNMADTITGGNGNDILDGAAGDDTLNGGPGNDTYFIDSPGDVLIDASGIDTVMSTISKTLGAGLEHLTLLGTAALNGTGNGAANTLTGNDARNVLKGLGGNDTLKGMDGNDTLTGGSQRDLLFGGPGQDFFDFNKLSETKRGAARDKILDFKHAQHDKIDLRDIDAKTGVGGNQKFKFIGKHDFHDVKGELRYIDKGATCIVQGDVNGDGKADFEIFVNAGALLKGDFLL